MESPTSRVSKAPTAGSTFGGVKMCLEGLGNHLEHDLPLLENAAFGIKPIVTEAIHAGTDLDLLRTLSDANELPQLLKTTAFIQCLRALSQNG